MSTSCIFFRRALSSLPRNATPGYAKSALAKTPWASSSPSSCTKSFHTSSRKMADPTLNSGNISQITEAEQKITGSDEVVKGGPTAQAQSHAGEPINSQTLHDITGGEKKITGGERVKGGPTSTAQSILGRARNDSQPSNNSASSSATLDSDTISKITEAEKTITGSAEPVPGGPTAQAQKHANQPIDRNSLHDITDGEKKVTGRDGPVAGGPTATAQSVLTNSRS